MGTHPAMLWYQPSKTSEKYKQGGTQEQVGAPYQPKPPDEIRRNMAAIRSEGNKTEAMFRKRVHRMGLRYRKYPRGLVGRPDFVFPSSRVAVFVDGDFWHGRILLEEGLDALRLRVRERTYWIAKLQTRVARDKYVTRELEVQGWLVLRFWESDVKRNVDEVAREIVRTVTAEDAWEDRHLLHDAS